MLEIITYESFRR